MDNLLKQLSDYLIENYTNEEVLFRIFEYLRGEIPFERVGCHLINRKNNLLTTFVEYTFDERIPAYSYYLSNPMPIEELDSLFLEVDSLVYGNLIAKKKSPYIEQLPYKVESYVLFPFNMPEDLSSYCVFGCYSSKENAFTKEHYDIIIAIKPYLEKLISDLYVENNNSSHILLADVGQLPSTYEEQLRACPGMAKVMRRVDTVSKEDLTVLIHGATGTGKELVAETIHMLSHRRNKAFVRVNCGAIPDSLLESELFGYERGAFTGASATRKGYFEQADGGTIFLDEVGELSSMAQTRLLRAIENQEIQRIGAEHPIKFNVRIIAATHRNLWAMVQSGDFREDLFYRLNIFPINILPLSHRKEDIRILIEYLYQIAIKKFKLDKPPIVTNSAFRQLIEYPWPGNVRQLKASIDRGIFEAISDHRDEIDFSFLPENNFSNEHKHVLTREEIIETLEISKGKIQGKNGAAEMLQINAATLRSRMQVLGIDHHKFTASKTKKNTPRT